MCGFELHTAAKFVSIEIGGLHRGEIDFRAGDIIDQVGEAVLRHQCHDLDDLALAEPRLADGCEVIGGYLARASATFRAKAVAAAAFGSADVPCRARSTSSRLSLAKV